MYCSPPGSSVHGVSQARILKLVAISFSRGASRPRDYTRVFCVGRHFLYYWAPLGSPFNFYEVLFINLSFYRLYVWWTLEPLNFVPCFSSKVIVWCFPSEFVMHFELFLCKIWDRLKFFFFLFSFCFLFRLWESIGSHSIFENCSFPTELFLCLCQRSTVHISVGLYLSSLPLICLFIPLSVPCSLEYYSSVTPLKIRLIPHALFLFLSTVLAILVSLPLHKHFKVLSSISTKKSCWDFDKNYSKAIYQYRKLIYVFLNMSTCLPTACLFIYLDLWFLSWAFSNFQYTSPIHVLLD